MYEIVDEENNGTGHIYDSYTKALEALEHFPEGYDIATLRKLT